MIDLSDPISRQQTIAALRALSDEDGYINVPHEVVTDVVRGLPHVRAEHEQTTQSEQPKKGKLGVKTGETCEDCISRQAAIDALHMHLMYRMGTDSNKKRLDEWINNLPPAEPKKGKWIKTARWGRVYYCDQCRNYLDFDGVNAGRGSTNFCPNCGAKMRGEHDG